jgi:hypothetical protein
MSDPLELTVEKLAVGLLRASSDVLAVIPSERIFVEADDTGPEQDRCDRIVCTSSPREPERTGHIPTLVLVWRVPLAVTIHSTTLSADQMQSAIDGIQAAFAVAPTDALLDEFLDAQVGEVVDTEEGDFETQQDLRKRSKTWNFLATA